MRRCLLLLAAALCGCHSTQPPLPAATFSSSLALDLGVDSAAPPANDLLTSENPSQSAVVLWDGKLGVNIGPYGLGRDFSGKPLPAFRYDWFKSALPAQIGANGLPVDLKKSYGDESLQPLSNPVDFTILANGEPVMPSAEKYRQTLDLRSGLLTTNWFAPVKGGYLEVRVSELVTNGALHQVIEFHGPIGTLVKVDLPAKNPLAACDEYDGAFTPGPFKEDNPAVGTLTGGSVTLDAGFATWRCLALLGSETGKRKAETRPWKAVLTESQARLSGPKAPQLTIDGPEDDQKAINSFLYYLRSSLPPGPSMQISPFGLSSDRYNGHVFWDADIWVMPALALLEPSILDGLSEYRRERIQSPPNPPFPWESSLTGKETAPGDSKKEIHISGSVLYGLEMAEALGATAPDGVIKRVADYYRGRATLRSDGKLALLNVMSPDENHIGANDLYTNLVAQWALNGATWTPAHPTPNPMYLPADSTSFLTYDNDPLKGYKQAAAVLAIYPLQYPPAEAQAKAMMDRFEKGVNPHGPAMSDSIHATIWARLGEPDKAYDRWEKSWKEFVQGPELMFSEKRGTPTGYFVTGAAGCLQTVLYGFLGLRIDEKPLPDAAWKFPLRNHRWLSVKPELPSAWKSATLKHFYVLGKPYTLTAKREGSKTVTSIHQGD